MDHASDLSWVVVADAGPLFALSRVQCLPLLRDALLIIDDRVGRAEARARGLSIMGVAAVIGLARRQGLVPSAAPILHARARTATTSVARSSRPCSPAWAKRPAGTSGP